MSNFTEIVNSTCTPQCIRLKDAEPYGDDRGSR